MEIVLFGDTFDIIRCLLIPIDLHRLRLSCKRYNHQLTDSDTFIATISEMKRRLNTIFDGKYCELERVLQMSNGMISGSFVIQCMLGETWIDSTIKIYIRVNNDKLYEFLSQYEAEPRDNIAYNDDIYIINGIRVRFLKVSNFAPVGSNNRYEVATNELVIDKSNEKFRKCVNMFGRSRLNMNTFDMAKMYRRGFQFHDNGKILSKNDIIDLYYLPIIINAKKSRMYCMHYIKNDSVMIENMIIYGISHITIALFDITASYNTEKYITPGRIKICECLDSICIVLLVHPKLEHYHLGFAFSNIILIPNYA